MASRAMLSLVTREDEFQPRYRLLLSAKLATTADEFPVKVRELWAGGAVVEGHCLPRIGKDVLLSRGGTELFGSVRSHAERACEIQFEEELDEGDLLLWMRPLQDDISPLPSPQFRRPGLRSSRPSAKDWELVHSWGYLHGKAGFGD